MHKDAVHGKQRRCAELEIECEDYDNPLEEKDFDRSIVQKIEPKIERTHVDKERAFQSKAKTSGQPLRNGRVNVQRPHSTGGEFFQIFPTVFTPEETCCNTRWSPAVIVPVVIVSRDERHDRSSAQFESNSYKSLNFSITNPPDVRWGYFDKWTGYEPVVLVNSLLPIASCSGRLIFSGRLPLDWPLFSSGMAAENKNQSFFSLGYWPNQRLSVLPKKIGWICTHACGWENHSDQS